MNIEAFVEVWILSNSDKEFWKSIGGEDRKALMRFCTILLTDYTNCILNVLEKERNNEQD